MIDGVDGEAGSQKLLSTDHAVLAGGQGGDHDLGAGLTVDARWVARRDIGRRAP
jgi:hypothetical protein